MSVAADLSSTNQTAILIFSQKTSVGATSDTSQTGESVIDWTWEREWRVCCDELTFTAVDAIIVVPDQQWANELRRIHDADQDMTVELYAQAVDRELAELWREEFRWRIIPLG